MTLDTGTKVQMYGIDGGRREVPLFMKEELLKKGWKMGGDSAQEYRPELDQTQKGYRESGAEEVEVVDGEFLEIKVV